MNIIKGLKIVIPAIICAILLVLGYFFAFRLSGYGIMAMLCYGLAALICVFAALNIFGKKHKKAARLLRRVLIAMLCVGFVFFSITEAIIIGGARSETGREADYIIVLGAGVDGKRPSRVLSDRLYAALSYLDLHPNAKAVVSGAQGPHEEITEAECMYLWLVENGIKPERIIKEDRARSTAQNVAYSMELIRADAQYFSPMVSVGVVTSEFHLYRAKLIAKKNGIANPIGIAAGTSLPVIKVNYFIREAAAVSAFWAFGK